MKNKKPKTYLESGVDLGKAKILKESIKDIAESSFNKNVISGPGAFGGVFNHSDTDEDYLVSSTDGVGTKLRIANILNNHFTVGESIVNHCINDILPSGATPLFFLDYIGANGFDTKKVTEIVQGISYACKQANCVLLGGETASMPDTYNDEDYDLVGFIVGKVKKVDYLSSSKTSAGDLILGLPSNGLHTNGYSLVRNIFDTEKNPEILEEIVPKTDKKLGEILLLPHKSYLDDLSPILKNINGLSHITGGGFYKNIPRSIGENLSAEIQLDAWTTPAIYEFIKQEGNVDLDEMYRVFNMGIGMAVFINPDKYDEIKKQLPNSIVIGKLVENFKEKDSVKLIGL